MDWRKVACLGALSGLLLVAPAFAFRDLTAEHWAYDVVNKMQGNGIISGFADNTFQPENSVTREQFATMLVKTLNLPEKTSTVTFDDVEADRWSKKYIETVAGFISGEMIHNRYCFRPESEAIREEVASAVVKAKHMENQGYNPATLDMFVDKDAISEDAKKYVAIAVENGIMKGNIDKTFNPKGRITRAEITALMYNLLKMSSTSSNTGNKQETKDSVVSFEGKYVNNDKKYAEIVFRFVNDRSFEMCLKGYNEKDGVFGIHQPIVVSGTAGSFSVDGVEKLKMTLGKNFVVITATEDAYSLFEGTYQLDSSASVIEGLPLNQWNAIYSIGEKPEVSSKDPAFLNVVYKMVGFTAKEENRVEFNASALVNGSVTSLAGTGILEENRLVYSTPGGSVVFWMNENGELQTEVSDSAYKALEGIYTKQTSMDKFMQYKNMVDNAVIPYGAVVLSD